VRVPLPDAAIDKAQHRQVIDFAWCGSADFAQGFCTAFSEHARRPTRVRSAASTAPRSGPYGHCRCELRCEGQRCAAPRLGTHGRATARRRDDHPRRPCGARSNLAPFSRAYFSIQYSPATWMVRAFSPGTRLPFECVCPLIPANLPVPPIKFSTLLWLHPNISSRDVFQTRSPSENRMRERVTSSTREGQSETR
jgi:hypothetical protein